MAAAVRDARNSVGFAMGSKAGGVALKGFDLGIKPHLIKHRLQVHGS
jgi:hypothetical protein